MPQEKIVKSGRLAEADAFRCLRLDRRQAIWAIQGLSDSALPLFAAADAGGPPAPEIVEPVIALAPMKAGREVVEDYSSIGLSLRQHPISFLRRELARQQMVTCAALAIIRDGRKVTVAGMVLVRQKPGSAKGVLFLTIEDETGVANVIVWPSLLEQQRRLILSAGMVVCHGRLQKEAGVIHVIAERLEDYSGMLGRVGQLGQAKERERGLVARGLVKEDYNPDLLLGGGIKVPTRDFR